MPSPYTIPLNDCVSFSLPVQFSSFCPLRFIVPAGHHTFSPRCLGSLSDFAGWVYDVSAPVMLLVPGNFPVG